MISPIELLVCGNASATPDELVDEKSNVLVGLGRLVTSYFDFAVDFNKALDTPQASYFMPVALRSLMESSGIALLARVDPLRIVHSSLSQSAEIYIKSRQQASALKWKGDIIGDDPIVPKGDQGDSPSQKSSKSIWDPNIGPTKLPRALLSEQMCEAFWAPASKNMNKWISSSGQGADSPWTAELTKIAPEDLLRTIVGSGSQVYSELSKGIHPEFAVRREVEFDAATLATYFDRAAKWVAGLSLLSHFCGGLSAGITSASAYEAFRAIEGAVNVK